MDSILFWNKVALDAVKTDFSLPDPRPPELMPQQPGPTYTSRALAIVHLAMYDAFVGIMGGANTYLTYAPTPPVTGQLPSARAAVAAAACLTLIAMYSRQKDSVLASHSAYLAMLPAGGPGIAEGLAWGHLVASQLLATRKEDGADASDDQYAPSNEAGSHRPDPYSPTQGFLGPRWGEVQAFGFNSIRTTLPALPPPRTLPEYAADFAEVFTAGRKMGSSRTLEETTIGLFWAYDGARNIGVPPRLYNQVVRRIVRKIGTVGELQNAKLFAMVNLAMADAGIQAWHEKYKHNLWRPVIGIREAEAPWGPTGTGFPASGAAGDPYWEPLGAPRTNSSGRESFTPNFPAYPSGHATFGTAALRVAQTELGVSDDFKFNFYSDEFNGENVGATGVRPKHNRRLTIPQAIEENILSRVYLGVHWRFDGLKGQEIGEKIAEEVTTHFPAKA